MYHTIGDGAIKPIYNIQSKIFLINYLINFFLYFPPASLLFVWSCIIQGVWGDVHDQGTGILGQPTRKVV